MLEKILSITGKPGLYEIVTHSPKNLIVEEILSKKRMPVSMRDKVVSLGDIAIYTVEDDKPLGEVLDLVYVSEKGEKIDVKKLLKDGTLRDKFAEIMPDFDEERVRDNDIKKLLTWYNLLIEAGLTKFTEDKEETKEEKEEETSDKDSKKESEEDKEKEKPTDKK